MEGSLSLNVKDDITLHLDHKVHGQHRPCTVFVSCDEGEIGIGINIIGKPHHDDVGVTIENGRLVTIQVKPVHAFLRQFCIDGPSADEEWDKAQETVDGPAQDSAPEKEDFERKIIHSKSEPKGTAPTARDPMQELASRLQAARDQLESERKAVAENEQRTQAEIDRLRQLEKEYHEVVLFFNTHATSEPARTACQEMVNETEKLIRERTLHTLQCKNQGLVEAIKQTEQKRKNEQTSRIYYQELVHSIRAVVVDQCKQARGCSLDDLTTIVKAAVTLAHQKGLAQAIERI